LLPGRTLDRRVLLPMRWAVQGTIDAARMAVAGGAAINLAGGYHHAHRDRGEGFCLYADVPIAIEMLRKEKLLSENARVAIIDLDAHRGNGFEAIYEHDERVQFFDLYNFQVYPGPLQGPASVTAQQLYLGQQTTGGTNVGEVEAQLVGDDLA
jgi:histone deacetylase 11